jgi:hypothetical protein
LGHEHVEVEGMWTVDSLGEVKRLLML